jgi:beta-glucosidase
MCDEISMNKQQVYAAATACICAAGVLAAPRATERGLAHPELWPRTQSAGLIGEPTETFVTQLMTDMSLEEKVGQMIQADVANIKPDDLRRYPLGSILAGGGSPPLNGEKPGYPQAWVDTVRAFRGASLEPRAGHTPIPVMFGIDAVHGNAHVAGATIFPHNVGLGAARDPDLLRRIGQATAEETAAIGIDWVFAPTLAAPQDMRWGRTYEGYSENPTLVREYAAQMVLGLQGAVGTKRLVQNGRVAATAKHFLGDGGTTDGVDQGDTDIDEAELIRLHAQGYPPAIEAGVMTVMASYSSWQGRKMHGNESLLTGVLKNRWGFAGFVVGDWNGHSQLPNCTKRNCPAAINAGIDMVMAPDGWQGFFDNTVAQVRSGVIPMSRIDDAVRRILRVKVKLGLFEENRPLEGRIQVLGSPEHRALAREAVRKSMVLLKNNGGVLPIRGSAHVLVAGGAADDIGRQCGGWTLSWQGTGNKNSDFPNGQSIYAGLRAALEAAGGTAEFSVDGSFNTRPDVAVVVYGELPSAEMRGDLSTLEYDAGGKRDLALLKKLKAAGVPVVSIFLSGRPMWVNPELNASDAFVAAWLPGSEGGGVADLLVGDTAGNARFNFSGRLSYSWPKTAAQNGLKPVQKSHVPLFSYGHGLTYEDHLTVARLSESSGVLAVDANVYNYLIDGRNLAPWHLALRAGSVTNVVPAGGESVSGEGAIVTRAVSDADPAAGARALIWNGHAEASAVLTGPPINLVRESNADMSLLIEYRLDHMPSAPVYLEMGCGPACRNIGSLRLEPFLTAVPVGEWRTLKVNLSCFREAGADLARIAEPFVITTDGGLALSLRSVRLEADPAGAICPKTVRDEAAQMTNSP